MEEQREFESKSDVADNGPELVRYWLAQFEAANKCEKEWRKRAREAVERYNGEKNQAFNILRSNVTTLRPSMYNSAPIPDIRRRHGDQDPAAKMASQILERCVSLTFDDDAWDRAITLTVQDMLVPGRGVLWARFDPTIEQSTATESENVVNITPVDVVTGARVWFEHVKWDELRFSPVSEWDRCEWLRREHHMSLEQLIELIGDEEKANRVPRDLTIEGMPQPRVTDGAQPNLPDTATRARVWEVWDKTDRRVVHIAENFAEGPLRVESDPLGLVDFWPIPTPLYASIDGDSMVPVEDYRAYREQAIELDTITQRIASIVECIKYRGVYADVLNAMGSVMRAKDGEFVPIDNFASLAAQYGQGKLPSLDDYIWVAPIEEAARVLAQLYVAREQTKQIIYEITGISDVQRGASNPNETLGAQEIKLQFGSTKTADRQRRVQRLARNCTRIIAELLAEHVPVNVLAEMSGVDLVDPVYGDLSQPVAELLTSDQLRFFRIDIETDSTIADDVGAQHQQMAQFVQGLGQFIQSVGPAVQSGYMTVDVAIDLIAAFARRFKLGKQAEDALERWAQTAKESQQQQQDPMPEEIAPVGKSPEELAMEQSKLQAEMGLKQAELELKRQQATADVQLREREIALKEQQAGVDAAKSNQDIALKERAVLAQEYKDTNEIALKARQMDTQRMEQSRQDVVSAIPGLMDAIGQISVAVQASERAAETMEGISQTMQTLIDRVSQPRKVVRDGAGRIAGLE